MTTPGTARFRKKPVEIEAKQFLPGTPAVDALTGWLTANGVDYWLTGHELPSLMIPTPEGEMQASPGDWVIKGVKGEFYPCKPDIFAATYEPVYATTVPDQGEPSVAELRQALYDACDVAVWLTGMGPIEAPAWPAMRSRLHLALSVAGYGMIESEGEVVGFTKEPL